MMKIFKGARVVSAYENIPIELRVMPRWCFTGKDADEGMAKAPHYFNEQTGKFELLSVHNYHNCLPFDELEPLLADNPERGFGYIMVDGDGYTCIDLDVKDDAPVDASRRHWELIVNMDTYTEVSQSGCGVHMWLRGEIDGAIKTNELEVYSRERFIICTGNVLADKPIAYDPESLEFFNVRAKEGATSIDVQSKDQTMSDDEIMEKATASDHSGKLAAIMSGDWDAYTSIMQGQGQRSYTFDASQADAAFMAIITHYTQNYEQAVRLWDMTALANVVTRYPNSPTEQRKKAKNLGSKYKLTRAFSVALAKNIRDKEERERQAELGKQATENFMAQYKPPKAGSRDPMAADIPMPPGQLGKLAQYFMARSYKPIPEFAIFEALSFCASIFGNKYTIDKTGVNLYLCVTAPSGFGKGALTQLPSEFAAEYNLGDHYNKVDYSHGQSLTNTLNEVGSMCYAMDEFGQKLAQAMSGRTSPAATIINALVRVFDASGATKVKSGTQYTGADKSVIVEGGSALSVMAEGVHETITSCLTPAEFADGTISRFIMYNYTRHEPLFNDNTVLNIPSELNTHMEHIIKHVVLGYSSTPVPVQLGEGVREYLTRLDHALTNTNNRDNPSEVMRGITNRKFLKIRKVAANIAIFNNCAAPVITMEHVEWAEKLLELHERTMRSFVSEGDIQTHEQDDKVSKLIKTFLTNDFKLSQMTKFKIEDNRAKNRAPYSYISERLKANKPIKTMDSGRQKQAVEQLIQESIESGYITELPREGRARFFSLA